MKHLLWFVMPVSIIMAIFAIHFNKDLTISSWLYNLNNVKFQTLDAQKIISYAKDANIFTGLSFDSFSSILKSTRAIFTVTRNIYNLNRSFFNMIVYLLKFITHNLGATIKYIQLNLGME